MKLRERIRKRFKQLGLRYLRAPKSEADGLAEAVSWSHDRLGAFTEFCCAPTLRTQELNRAILVRWLETIPVLLTVPGILARKSVVAGDYTNLSKAAQNNIYATASGIASTGLALPEPKASHFADCIMLCASPAFAFYQRCMAPEEHTLEVLAGSLAAFAGVLPHAAAAHQLSIGHRAEG